MAVVRTLRIQKYAVISGTFLRVQRPVSTKRKLPRLGPGAPRTQPPAPVTSLQAPGIGPVRSGRGMVRRNSSRRRGRLTAESGQRRTDATWVTPGRPTRYRWERRASTVPAALGWTGGAAGPGGFAARVGGRAPAPALG